MAANTYGLKMIGLSEASAETRSLPKNNPFGEPYVQISYDISTGDILTNYHYSNNNWSDYRDPNVSTVMRAYEPMTMQEIADAIKAWMDDRESEIRTGWSMDE